jgi:hypothetical protein
MVEQLEIIFIGFNEKGLEGREVIESRTKMVEDPKHG